MLAELTLDKLTLLLLCLLLDRVRSYGRQPGYLVCLRTHCLWFDPHWTRQVKKKIRICPVLPEHGTQTMKMSWSRNGRIIKRISDLGMWEITNGFAVAPAPLYRNYVSLDILHRVIEDYFGYNVLFVENITDIDDKVLKKIARLCHRRGLKHGRYYGRTQLVPFCFFI